MQYLLIDTHKRPIGTLVSDKVFSVGDTFENQFENQNAQLYTVIGLNWHPRPSTQSLTVMPVKTASRV